MSDFLKGYLEAREYASPAAWLEEQGYSSYDIAALELLYDTTVAPVIRAARNSASALEAAQRIKLRVIEEMVKPLHPHRVASAFMNTPRQIVHAMQADMSKRNEFNRPLQDAVAAIKSAGDLDATSPTPVQPHQVNEHKSEQLDALVKESPAIKSGMSKVEAKGTAEIQNEVYARKRTNQFTGGAPRIEAQFRDLIDLRVRLHPDCGSIDVPRFAEELYEEAKRTIHVDPKKLGSKRTRRRYVQKAKRP